MKYPRLSGWLIKCDTFILILSCIKLSIFYSTSCLLSKGTLFVWAMLHVKGQGLQYKMQYIYSGTLKCDHLDNLTTLPKRPLFSWPGLVKWAG